MLQAETLFPLPQVVPWNGYKAATSLTFDGGKRDYLDKVIPELNRRQWRGTFFLIANQTDRKDEWRQAIKAGHEIGNQTLDCFHPEALSPRDENGQVIGAQNVLQKEFGVSLYSFAYPYGEVSPGLKGWVAKTSFLARGQTDGLVSSEDTAVDWFNLPSKTLSNRNDFETDKGWIDDANGKGNWLIWDIQGMDDTPSGLDSISLQTLERILDYLQTKDIWVGTFLEVGSYLRAWRAFESAEIRVNGSETVYHWVVPDHCPMNVILKIRFPQGSPSVRVRQKGEPVAPDTRGNYAILFNKGQLSLWR
jgi:peptidoglycan/xylan/chitin deacetylase (PgdA/CDA1 family)